MKPLKSSLVQIMARVSISVKNAALSVGVINPWPLFWKDRYYENTET